MNEFTDKLIGRLEAQKMNAEEGQEVIFQNEGHSLDYEFLYGRRDAFKEIIEIVKELAEEYNNDFCEWGEKGNYYITECSNETGVMYNIKPNYKFCPYCGKEIKVVE